MEVKNGQKSKKKWRPIMARLIITIVIMRKPGNSPVVGIPTGMHNHYRRVSQELRTPCSIRWPLGRTYRIEEN